MEGAADLTPHKFDKRISVEQNDFNLSLLRDLNVLSGMPSQNDLLD